MHLFFSFQNLQVQLYYILQQYLQHICCICCYSFTWSGDLTGKMNPNFPKARIQPCHHIKKWTGKTELEIQSLSKSQCHEHIPDWHSLSMIKYTIINKPKSAEIFSCLRSTGTPTMPEPTSPHDLSLYSSSLQHIPLSRLVSILTWATAQQRRVQEQDPRLKWQFFLRSPTSSSINSPPSPQLFMFAGWRSLPLGLCTALRTILTLPQVSSGIKTLLWHSQYTATYNHHFQLPIFRGLFF